jgi:SAM-dependent methyltransferase
MNRIVLSMVKSKISSNEMTLRAYDADISSYLKYTPATYDASHHLLVQWINESVNRCPSGGTILEIGSGSGRDALYIKSLGHDITCSDAAKGFINHLRTLPLKTLEFDLLKDEVPEGYSMIFANAVFPHFTRDETIKAINKIYSALPTGGVLAFNVKQGSGSLWITEKFMHKRYMKFWNPNDIVELATKTGFKVIYQKTNLPGDLKTHTWTHLILEK